MLWRAELTQREFVTLEELLEGEKMAFRGSGMTLKTRSITLLLSLLAISTAHVCNAQAAVSNAPTFQKGESPYSKAPIVSEIHGLLLIPNGDYVNYGNAKRVEGLEVHDLYVPGGVRCLAKVLEPLFMGRPLTTDLLKTLKEQIVYYYREHDHPVVSVWVPEQEVTDGVLQLVVMEGCVGQIACSGQCWFSSRLYENAISLGPGDAITADTLLTDVSWINRNPFRNVDLVFTPGCDPGTTNIELLVDDRFPVQVYGGADNAGTSSTGSFRWYTGVTWGNAFFLDHILNYQFASTKDLHEFKSHTVHYTAPLPWRHLLILYGGYSSVHPDLENFRSKGHNSTASLRYTIPFGKNYCTVLGEFTLGFDYKNFNNNLDFVSGEVLPLITSSVNLSQFMLGYAIATEDCCRRFSFNLDVYGSPAKMLPKESRSRYEELSRGARVRYAYGLLTTGYTRFLPYCFSFSALGRLQLASGALLPSERFGIGGYDTVRGYEERQFNVDNALVLNAELRTPPFSFFNFFNCCYNDEMFFLVFFDYGLGNLRDRKPPKGLPSVGDKIGKTEYFMSFGPGWRYTICDHLSARLDWGIKLHRSIHGTKARSRFHGGFVLSF
ncbi:MAG: Heme/hemopexin transporter protein HuxB [Chlamydiae bacterium]|nr:Heme/hemopexin transporter protein HuxB [Chlamydiota bacterium]